MEHVATRTRMDDAFRQQRQYTNSQMTIIYFVPLEANLKMLNVLLENVYQDPTESREPIPIITLFCAVGKHISQVSRQTAYRITKADVLITLLTPVLKSRFTGQNKHLLNV